MRQRLLGDDDAPTRAISPRVKQRRLGPARAALGEALQRVGTQGVTFIVGKGRSHPSGILLQVLSAWFRDRAGNALDGAFANTFPSGTGQAGVNFVATLPVVPPKRAKPSKPPRRAKH